MNAEQKCSTQASHCPFAFIYKVLLQAALTPFNQALLFQELIFRDFMEFFFPLRTIICCAETGFAGSGR